MGRPPKAQPPSSDNRIIVSLYGAKWKVHPPPNVPWADQLIQQQIERKCFLAALGDKDFVLHKGNQGALHHFKQFVDCIWNHPKSTQKFIWTPYAEEIFSACIKEKFIAVAGHAASGKSHAAAMWAVVMFLMRPTKTAVMTTSTNLKEARRRVWGKVKDFWSQACMTCCGEDHLPGKMVDSQGFIRCTQGDRSSDTSGVMLIPGEKSQEKESIGKLIGFHNEIVILIADEHPELSENLLVAADTNLNVNPHFQMLSLGNPKSRFDAFGTFIEPEDGWESINLESYQWRGKSKAYVIRFDGAKCPNVELKQGPGEESYPGILHYDAWLHALDKYGANSAHFMRMFRAFPMANQELDAIYYEEDFIKYNSLQSSKSIPWEDPPTIIAVCDPSYEHGGDKAVAYFGLCGFAKGQSDEKRKKVLVLTERVQLDEDMVQQDKESKPEQIAKLFISACKSRGVQPRHVAVDHTGGGGGFSTALSIFWSNDFLKVQFQSKASTSPVSMTDKRPGHEVYTNCRSEIWYSGKEFLRTGQWKLGEGKHTKIIINELTASRYDTVANRLKVESKEEMKKRIGRSPDDADSALLGLHLCRVRLGMVSVEKAAKEPRKAQFNPLSSLFPEIGGRRRQMTMDLTHNGPTWG